VLPTKLPSLLEKSTVIECGPAERALVVNVAWS
jgi:hypothetical protein